VNGRLALLGALRRDTCSRGIGTSEKEAECLAEVIVSIADADWMTVTYAYEGVSTKKPLGPVGWMKYPI